MKTWINTILVAATISIACAAHAAWPDKPVRIVVPYAVGGAADALARVIAAELGIRLKQPIIVENKAGAGGTIGAQAVAQAPADGYTFLYDATSFAVNPSSFSANCLSTTAAISHRSGWSREFPLC